MNQQNLAMKQNNQIEAYKSMKMSHGFHTILRKPRIFLVCKKGPAYVVNSIRRTQLLKLHGSISPTCCETLADLQDPTTLL